MVSHVITRSNLADNDLRDVKQSLDALWGSSSLRLLNVSYNKKLTFDGEWAGFQLETLDISGTSISLRPEMCTNNISIFASEAAQLDKVAISVRRCSQTAKLLDISALNATLIQEALSENFEALTSNGDKRHISFRLQTTWSPVQCGLRQGTRFQSKAANGTSLTWKYEYPVMQYQCRCSSGYVQGSDGMCRKFWSSGRIAGLVLGVASLAILPTLASTFVCLRLRQRRLRLAFDLDLHKGLLEETASDVMALKRAWEVDWGDVKLTTRIDQGAEGAFGEV